MFCPNCGTNCEEDAAFCPNCGTSLTDVANAAGETVSAGTDTGASEVTFSEPKAEESGVTFSEPKAETSGVTFFASEQPEGGQENVGTEQPNAQFNSQPGGQADDSRNMWENRQEPNTQFNSQFTGQPNAQFNSQPGGQANAWNGQPNTQFNGQPGGQANAWNGQPNAQFNGQPGGQANAWNGQPNTQFNGQPNTQFNGQFVGQPNMGQPNMPNMPKKSSKVPKILIAVVAAVVVLGVLAGVVIGVGKNATNYKKTANKFVEAVAAGKYDKALDYMTLPESEFLTAEAFKKANGDAPVGEITAITINDAYATASAATKRVNVNYVLNIGKAANLTLDMEKSDETVMLFFKKYKINANSLLTKDVAVIIPKGMKLKVNGIDVDSKYILDEEKAAEYSTSSVTDVYKIPYLFTGDAEFTVCGDIIEDFVQDMELSKDVSKINLSSKSYQYSKETLDKVVKQAEDDFKALVKAGLDKKSFDSIESMASSKNKNNVMSDYNYYFLNTLNSSIRYFESMNITDVKASTTSSSYSATSTSTSRIRVSLSYKSAGTYVYETTGNRYVQSERTYSSSYIYYVYEDGKWVIYDLYTPLNTTSGTLQKDGTN